MFKSLRLICGVSALALTVSACGGGGGGSTTTEAEAPEVSSNASVREASDFSHLKGINALTSYDLNLDGSGVSVAIIDTGVTVDQVDLAGRISEESKSFVGDENVLTDTLNHGTGVASLIGAASNASGIVGVAHGADLMVLKADSASGSFTASVLTEALTYAHEKGADIINMSLAGTMAPTTTLMNALDTAIDGGALIVTAAGNRGASSPDYPGRYAGTFDGSGELIAVGAVDANNQIASFSNRAGNVKNHFLVAPGVNVTVVGDNGQLTQQSGTSFAAPLVSGAAALLKQQSPHLNGGQIATLLLENAQDLGAPGVDNIYGHGLLDVGAALQPFGAARVPSGASVNENQSNIANLEDTFVSIDPVIASAIKSSGALEQVTILDTFDRAYQVDLSQSVVASAASLDVETWMFHQELKPVQQYALGSNLQVRFGEVQQSASKSLIGSNGFMFAEMALPSDQNVSVAYNMPTSALLDLGNKGSEFGYTSVRETKAVSPYLDAAGQDFALAYGANIRDGLNLKVAGSLGFATATDATFSDPSHMLAVSAAAQPTNNLRLAVTLGSTRLKSFEDNALFYVTASGAFQMQGGLEANFAKMNTDWNLSENTQLQATYALGQFADYQQQSGLVRGVENLKADAFALSLQRKNTGLAARFGANANDRLALTLSQPLNLRSGTMHLSVPTGRTLDGAVIRQDETIALTSDQRPLRLEADYSLSTKFVSKVSGAQAKQTLGLLVGAQQSAVRGVDAETYVGLKFKRNF